MTEIRKFLLLAIAGAAAAGLFFRPAWLRADGPVRAYPDLTPAEARDLLEKHAGDPDFVLLDVRTRKEFDEERIGGADLLDYRSASFREEIGRLDRGKSYLVYCRTGNRSTGALAVMRELGFERVHHLGGGIVKWKEAGIPTAR